MEAITLVECNIPSFNIVVHVFPDTTDMEECLLHPENLDEHRRDALTANEAHKNCVKNQYDEVIKPRVFFEVELVLLWDQDKEPLGERKFKSMWLGLYVVSKVLKRELMN